MRSEVRTPRTYSPDTPLFEADAARKGLRALSETRVQDTLIAESAELAEMIQKFRKKKTEHNIDSLCDLLQVDSEDATRISKALMEIGFLEEFGETFKIPMLYRDGLALSQGKAFADSGATFAVDDYDWNEE